MRGTRARAAGTLAIALSAIAAVTPSAEAGRMLPGAGTGSSYQLVGSAAGASPSVTFSCQTTTPAGCYAPAQIQAAYDFTPLYSRGIDGTGRTIVIVDAFQSPTIVHDLHDFDSLFGLPDPMLNILAPDGLTPFDQSSADQTSWAGEITLDVEYAHAIAPGATIDLVLAKSDQDADIFSATQFAVSNDLGDVISQSFGEAEQCMDPTLVGQEHALFDQASAQKITLLASSADQGAALPTCDCLVVLQGGLDSGDRSGRDRRRRHDPRR